MNIGSVLKSKAGGHYIKLELPRDKDGKLVGKKTRNVFPITCSDGTVLNEGDVLFLKDPRVELDELAEKGLINADDAVDRKNKIPSFVRFRVQLPDTKN
jgi:hypothetical protein